MKKFMLLLVLSVVSSVSTLFISFVEAKFYMLGAGLVLAVWATTEIFTFEKRRKRIKGVNTVVKRIEGKAVRVKK